MDDDSREAGLVGEQEAGVSPSEEPSGPTPAATQDEAPEEHKGSAPAADPATAAAQAVAKLRR